MVAGVVKFFLRLERMNEAIGLWEKTFGQLKIDAPELTKGLMTSILLVNRQTGHCHGIGIWRTNEESLAFESSALYKQRIGELVPFCVKPPLRESFEVTGGDLSDVLQALRKAA